MVQKKTLGIWATALLLGTLAIPAFGQAGGAGGGGRGAQFQQQMMDRMKTQLGVSDDEFKALQPKIEAVMTAQRATRGGGGFGGGRRGGQNGGNGGTPPAADPNAPAPSPTQAASRELQTTLENKDASADEIKAKLTALRDARAKAKEALTKAQGELQGLLTQRQEAVLVNMGMLD